MAHDIWEDRFVAIRTPAWHGIGTTFPEPVAPSLAAVEADLLYDVEKFPLTIETPNGSLDTGLIMIGRIEGTELVNYGVGKQFDIVTLNDVLSNLDDLHNRYPLSAAGALRSGAECFFSFEVSPSTEIAGEEYREYLTVLHSYTPGVAHKWIYSPVRVVCSNTLIVSEDKATGRLSVSHSANSKDRMDAGYIISDAMARASMIKKNLEKLTAVEVSDDAVTSIIEQTYRRYRPSDRLDPLLLDLVGEDTMQAYSPKNESQQRYYTNVCTTARMTYDRFNDEHPDHAGTAYGLYQAICETADHRKGKSYTGALESAVIGPKAAEKKTCYELLMELA